MSTVLDSSDYITFPFSKKTLLDKTESNTANLMNVDGFHYASYSSLLTYLLIRPYGDQRTPGFPGLSLF